MRIAALAALLLLATACASTPEEPSYSAATAAPSSSAATTSRDAAAGVAPGPGAPLSEVAAWIAAGKRVDGASYRETATDDGTASTLDEPDRAFVSPTGKIKCMTDSHDGRHGLVCLIDFVDPPEQPADRQGNWVGGWVEYAGDTLTVGGLHGDPGPFVRGYGNQLPYGSRLTLHDSECRLDTSGLLCVKRDPDSGFRVSDAGVIPFGCLSETTAPREVNAGDYYTC